MNKIKGKLGMVLAAGSVWGFMEVGMGMYLRGTCSRFITGSVMTGIAIFFFALAYGLTNKAGTAVILLGIASALKLLDAYLLHLPILHGAVANPIYAFVTEATAFIFVVYIVGEKFKNSLSGNAIMGALSALIAANLFPMVKIFTGIPACVLPGTNYPLALYYLPVSVGIAFISCPLGVYTGKELAGVTERNRKSILVKVIPQVATILSIVFILLLRVT